VKNAFVENAIASCQWKIDLSMLKEAAAIRRRDPNEFRSAVLTFFGLGGLDDAAIIKRMQGHQEGSRLLADEVPLPEGILNPTRYINFPRNSLGYIYYRHCHDFGLDPMFIAQESEKVARDLPVTPTHKYVYNRYRDSHDFWHILTGYGTDMAGEAGIIGWTYGQTGNKAYGLIALLNGLMCASRGKFHVLRTAWRGYRHGRASPLLLAIDWRRYMDVPLDEVRREIGLTVARRYPIFHMPDAPGAKGA
jgi:ubiquinone biosynthesis protein COQ4